MMYGQSTPLRFTVSMTEPYVHYHVFLMALIQVHTALECGVRSTVEE